MFSQISDFVVLNGRIRLGLCDNLKFCPILRVHSVNKSSSESLVHSDKVEGNEARAYLQFMASSMQVETRTAVVWMIISSGLRCIGRAK
jgi:hypothetical protein